MRFAIWDHYTHCKASITPAEKCYFYYSCSLATSQNISHMTLGNISQDRGSKYQEKSDLAKIQENCVIL